MERRVSISILNKVGLTAGLIAMTLASPAASQEVVDVELVLAVDVSLSMSPSELKIQRDGYASALVHEHVLNAIRDGLHGRIAVAYVEWAGDAFQNLVVPWTLIESVEDAERVANRIAANPPSGARRTSISGGLRYAHDLLLESSFRGMRRVIDVSGDGPNNQGDWVNTVRDEIVATGVTINGLPIMVNDGYSSVYDVHDLDEYYANCVIGGPGAFMIPVHRWEDFAMAVRRKLVLEIADTAPPLVWRASAEASVSLVPVADEAYDCQVGEKRWGDRFFMWEGR